MSALAHKIGKFAIGDEQIVTCEQCHHREPASCTSYQFNASQLVVTQFKPTKTRRSSPRSHPDAFPSALRQKRKTQTKIHQGKVLPKVRHYPSIYSRTSRSKNSGD
ncbi:DNA-directed RNA polymerase I kDa polypeptide [Lanmaoa asiatica]|nr:DNA-directed RNA polymerase I kDa polypeptide [Lanmaoa asiatica]